MNKKKGKIINKEQIAFEKWARTYTPKSISTSAGQAWQELEKYESGIYKHAGVYYAWLGWQARAALDKQDTSEIVKEIDIAIEQLDFPFRWVADLLTKIRNKLIGE
jgi:hypothetical protein